jgi:hypothetical protein
MKTSGGSLAGTAEQSHQQRHAVKNANVWRQKKVGVLDLPAAKLNMPVLVVSGRSIQPCHSRSQGGKAMALIAMTDADVPNLDLGRPLVFSDILDKDTFPLDGKNEGCYCYLCQQAHSRGDVSKLRPLTPSSGVFSSKVRCDREAPVYLCLEHMPHRDDQFESFSPDVAAELHAKLRERGK